MSKNKPLIIGITGGIGSGKSTVCKIFNALGVPIYDADSQAKSLMVNDNNLVSEIKISFGAQAYLPDSSLNRDYLAKTVFSNPEKLSLLNSLVHPAVARDFEAWILRNNDAKYLLKEAALLIESGAYKQLDKLIHVIAPIDLRIKRIKNRDVFRSEKEILKIINNQLSDKERNNQADFIINNDESELLITQVLELHKKFCCMESMG